MTVEEKYQQWVFTYHEDNHEMPSANEGFKAGYQAGQERPKVGIDMAVKMLTYVGCTNQQCDGNGVVLIGEDDFEQCQWCHELQTIEAIQKELKGGNDEK